MFLWVSWRLLVVIIFLHQQIKFLHIAKRLLVQLELLFNSYNFAELAENVGIEFETIKSGEHKDMFGGTRPSTEEEMAMIQEMINDSYEVFC